MSHSAQAARLEKTLAVKPGDPFYVDSPSTENELVSRRFRNSPSYSALRVVNGGIQSDKSAAPNAQAEILLSIATRLKNHGLGEKISKILEKIFGRKNEKFDLEGLSSQETSYLFDFFAVATRMLMHGHEDEVELLKQFFVQFNTTDLIRLLNLAAKEELGNQALVRGFSDALMVSR